MLGLKLNHVSKRGHWPQHSIAMCESVLWMLLSMKTSYQLHAAIFLFILMSQISIIYSKMTLTDNPYYSFECNKRWTPKTCINTKGSIRVFVNYWSKGFDFRIENTLIDNPALAWNVHEILLKNVFHKCVDLTHGPLLLTWINLNPRMDN